MQVWVAGKGVISAIGNNVQQNLDSLRQGKSGVGKITILRTNYAATLPAAEIKLSNDELIELASLNSDSRNALLSTIAAKEAIADAAIPDFKKWRSGGAAALCFSIG